MGENQLAIYPLTSERWSDFERLFGKDGAHGGCWCMWWRIPEDQFERQCGETNKNAMQEIVNSGKVTGIIAYIDDQPVGWCSLGPR
ncbi:MAG TPA: GNAT family N-acetyltransferase, partial [Bacillota bacterium]